MLGIRQKGAWVNEYDIKQKNAGKLGEWKNKCSQERFKTWVMNMQRCGKQTRGGGQRWRWKHTPWKQPPNDDSILAILGHQLWLYGGICYVWHNDILVEHYYTNFPSH